jgi:hypothetical protein
MALSIKSPVVTLWTECCNVLIVLLSVIRPNVVMLIVVMLNVIMLNVVMLNVMAPFDLWPSTWLNVRDEVHVRIKYLDSLS